MKIYTKTGDKGSTSLFGGGRVEKNTKRIMAYGDVDELSSQIGVVISDNPPSEVSKHLLRIQRELFVLGTDLSTPLVAKVKVPRITGVFTKRLEKEIDDVDKKLAPLKNFILPGGSAVAANLHLARTIARGAERSVVDLANEEKINPNAQIFLNRLSDWLFVMARYVNKIEGVSETVWKGRK